MLDDMNKALGIIFQTEEVQLHSIKESFPSTGKERHTSKITFHIGSL